MTFSSILSCAGAVAAAGLVLLACGGDDTSGSSSGSSGSSSSSGSSGSSGSSSGGACSAPATATQIGLFPAKASARLEQTTDALVVWDLGGGDSAGSGAGTTGSITKMAKSGGDNVVLYKPSVNTHVVLDVLAKGDDVFTVEEDNALDSTFGAVLLRIPAAGGAATTVATLAPGDGNLLAADDDSVYLTREESLYRVPRAGGVPTEIAKLGDTGFFAQIFEDDLFLTQASGPVWRIPRNAASPSEAVKLTDDSKCLGQLLAVDGGFYCAGGLDLTKLDGVTFATSATVYDLFDTPEDANATLVRFAGVDGTKLFFAAKGAPSNPVSMRSFAVNDTSTTAIACGVGSWVGSALDATSIYLLQLQSNDGSTPLQVVKIAR